MLVAFARYSSFLLLRHNLRFTTVMITGSIVAAIAGALLLGVVPTSCIFQ